MEYEEYPKEMQILPVEENAKLVVNDFTNLLVHLILAEEVKNYVLEIPEKNFGETVIWTSGISKKQDKEFIKKFEEDHKDQLEAVALELNEWAQDKKTITYRLPNMKMLLDYVRDAINPGVKNLLDNSEFSSEQHLYNVKTLAKRAKGFNTDPYKIQKTALLLPTYTKDKADLENKLWKTHLHMTKEEYKSSIPVIEEEARTISKKRTFPGANETLLDNFIASGVELLIKNQ